MAALGPAVVVVVEAAAAGCGLVEAHGAGFGEGSERRGTAPVAGEEAGCEWDSGPVGGFGLDTASEDELASGLVWSAAAVVSAETGRGLVGGSGLVLGSGGSGFAELGRSSAPGFECGSEPGPRGEPALGHEFAPRSSSPWTPEDPSEFEDLKLERLEFVKFECGIQGVGRWEFWVGFERLLLGTLA